jgi:hypothetical protein
MLPIAGGANALFHDESANNARLVRSDQICAVFAEA